MGRNAEAREILGRLRSDDGNVEEPRAVREYDEIVATVALEKEHASRNSYLGMFFGRNDGGLHIARRVQLSVWLQIVQEYVHFQTPHVQSILTAIPDGSALRPSRSMPPLSSRRQVTPRASPSGFPVSMMCVSSSRMLTMSSHCSASVMYNRLRTC